VEFILSSVAARLALAGLEVGLGLLQVGFGQDVPLEVRGGAVVVELRLRGRRPRGVQVVPHRGQARLATLGLCGQLLLIDLEKELALLDLVAFLDGQVDDLSHHEGGHVDLALGLDLSVGRDFGNQVDLLDLGGRDPRNVLVFATDECGQDTNHHDGSHDPENDFDFLRHPPASR
jgi:hypothetical protein